ncbi:MAG TPA: STM4012 family radical SAM protein [Pyrinomonadaceae bacterium]|nr:STM4012 family radical SAM protein [Pyrinomonadaceae bacterium]
MISLAQNLRQSPYVSYAYSYPHKTAYRPLDVPVRLEDAWSNENKSALFLYLHVPFCEMRCGFCNLFTTANPNENMITAYLDALKREAIEVRRALGDGVRFARVAIGGGTPTFLEAAELESLFEIAENTFECDVARIPASCETSPQTADEARLRLLRERGIDRISIGVQSFVEAEVCAAGRSQKTSIVEHSIERIRKLGFPVLNLDLMYGLPGQTVDSWRASLQSALRFEPEELYLYPLYVRPLTGMSRHPKEWDDIRLSCYREGRALLLSSGYEQVSMRMFRSRRVAIREDAVYCCQDDGMIGLGCGARSYTRKLHYSSEYAVGVKGIHGIIESYSKCANFSLADYGFCLSPDEERRRFVIKSLLRADGLDLSSYLQRFGCSVLDDFPQLLELSFEGLASVGSHTLKLTEAGLELSDAIGPWLYSTNVHDLMTSYELH